MNGFKVMNKQCATCIFSNASPISPERLAELEQLWAVDNVQQECHVATLKHEHVACRGHFNHWLQQGYPYPLDGIKDSLGFDSVSKENFVQIAERLGWITFIDMSKE